jgi:hypothetical protein
MGYNKIMEVNNVGTKIDYVALLKPLEKILENDKMEASDKIEMTLEVIKEVLKQAETNN